MLYNKSIESFYSIILPMAKLIKVSCVSCKTAVYRGAQRINEGRKFAWNVYCSSRCFSTGRTTRKILKCEYCNKKFERTPSQISPHNYCSGSCAAKQSNFTSPRYRVEPKTCAYDRCEKTFRGDNKYCSRQCGKNGRRGYHPDELTELLKLTAIEMQRTPAKREIRTLAERCARAFGTWNNAVIAAGLKPNRSHDHRMYKRVLAKALDGHTCDSTSEAIIDNWLYKNGIVHERYHRYPEGNCEADWAVTVAGKTVFVEYFGLANDSPRYDRSTKKKQALCRKYGIQLIEIYPRDLYPKMKTEEKLGGELARLGILPMTR